MATAASTEDVLYEFLLGVYDTEPTTGDFVKGRSATVGGSFHIAGTAVALLPHLSPGNAAALRRAMWDANQQGETLVINSDVLTKGNYKKFPSFSQISEDLLNIVIERAQPISNKYVLFNPSIPDDPHFVELQTVVGATGHSPDLIFYHLDYLKARRLIDGTYTGDRYWVSVLPAAIIDRVLYGMLVVF